MVAFLRFEVFSEDLAKGVHDLSADDIRVYLSNVAPNLATHTVKADIAEIAAGNGYTAGGESVTPVLARSGAVTTLSGTDIVWNGTGGSFGPYQHAILYNATAAGQPLIAAWSRATPVTTDDGDDFTLDFSSAGNEILTI